MARFGVALDHRDRWRGSSLAVLALRVGFVIFGLAAIRSLEIADCTAQAFAAVGLDYSSHGHRGAHGDLSGGALPRYWPLWCGSLAAYVALMLNQGYHSMPDVVATIVVAGSLISMLAYGSGRGSGCRAGELRREMAKEFLSLPSAFSMLNGTASIVG